MPDVQKSSNYQDEYGPLLKNLSSNPNSKIDINKLNQIKNDIMSKLSTTKENIQKKIQNQTGIITNLNSNFNPNQKKLNVVSDLSKNASDKAQ